MGAAEEVVRPSDPQLGEQPRDCLSFDDAKISLVKFYERLRQPGMASVLFERVMVALQRRALA